MEKDAAYFFLFWERFCLLLPTAHPEAVANPRGHSLPGNCTSLPQYPHASWLAGMILGGVMGWSLDDYMKVGWKIQLGLFLIPTVIYGLMFLGQKMPNQKLLNRAEPWRNAERMSAFWRSSCLFSAREVLGGA
ncbi:MAG: hypothetical protein R3C49_12075 [Planctomycetaceae bacterium]